MKTKYKRVLLKLTGELFGGKDNKGLDFGSIYKIAQELEKIRNRNKVSMVIVVGSGNIFRGREADGTGVDKATADYAGMMATIINALLLQEALERCGNNTRVLSSLDIPSVCEYFIRRRALRHLEKGRMVILGGGTGNPFFTTDSAAALRACELNCEVILKASYVDGIYDKDPRLYKEARMYKNISFQEALEKGIEVMDNTAFALCQRQKIPIVVFNINRVKNIERIIRGDKIGTLVS